MIKLQSFHLGDDGKERGGWEGMEKNDGRRYSLCFHDIIGHVVMKATLPFLV